jgi:acyl CoA:acetate/3-ketoacid CoA transferase beta subunit
VAVHVHGRCQGYGDRSKRIMVAMAHTARGKPKILNHCTLHLTSVRRINLAMREVCD